MKKHASILLIAIMMFSQLSYSSSTIFAESNTNQSEDFNISLEEGASLKESIINIGSESIYDSLKITLPNDVDLNEEKTKALTEIDMNLSYQPDSNTVLIGPKTQSLSIKLVLNDVLEENKIIVEGYTNNELVASKDFAFSVEQEPSNPSTNPPNDSHTVDTSGSNSLQKESNTDSQSTKKNEGTEADVSSSESSTQDTNTKVTESANLSEDMVTPFSGNLNVDVDLSPRNAITLSGNAASYDLNLKFTGSRTEYTDAKITIDLPITTFTSFTQDVNDLTIDGVVPTYDTSNQQLVYAFDSIDTGRSYERLLKINTENGFSPNGYELVAQASFQANEQLPVSDGATVTIESSGSASVSKEFRSVEGNDRNIPTPGSKTLWEIKLDIPKKETGQMFLKEGSEITIADLLPDGLSFDSMETGPTPTLNGNELTWQFDAPTIDDQTSSNTSLFSQTIQVWLTVDQGTAGSTQNNQVEVETTYIDDSNSTVSGEHQVEIVDSETANGDIEGNWYVPVHLGPSNGKGDFAPFNNKNPNPIVYDDALLGFSHGIAPLPESEPGDFQEYTTIYRIDPHLTLDKLSTPGGFVYRPNASYPSGVPLDEEPRFNIVASVNGEEQLLIENVEQGKTYTRMDLGLAQSDRVDYIKYDFTYAPSGMLNAGRPNYYFSVEEGYTGEVVNTFNVYGVDANGNSFNYRYHQNDRNTIAGPRSATIAPKPDDEPPIAYVGVSLMEQSGGEVVTGSNRMEVKLTNSNSSTLAMQERLETVVLMPPGVTINDNPNPDYIDKDGQSSKNSTSAAGGSYEILSNNFNESGRQLVRIRWNDRLLRPGNDLAARLDVTISENTPNHLLFQVYGFSGDEKLVVPEGEGSAITDTTLESDTEDLNEDSTVDEPRLKSGNSYYMRGEYQIESEKLVKGELDEAFSSFGQTVPNGDIDYQLSFTNVSGKDISSMTLIDVLPSVGDLGITDNVDRGSQFTPTLNGEITIPSSWTDRVDVMYSTAKNPKRDDLTRNTDYPDTTEQLNNPPGAQDPNWMEANEVSDWSSIHSFKIQSKSNTDWLEGESITISFTMVAPSAQEVSEDVLNGNIEPTSRAAWNSFAIATDNGQPVEPLRVGVYMNYTNSVTLLKKAGDGTELEGAEFKLLDGAGNEIETGLVTDENGEIIVEDLLLGDYEFIETKAPTGYQLDSTPIPFSVEATQQEPIEVVSENTPVPGAVELLKVGEDEEPLEGATFTLLNHNDEELQSGLTTDQNGQLLIEDLQPGNYQLVETKAPFGHELDETPITFEIVFNQQETLQLTMENEQSTGAVELTKTGEDGNVLEGVEFELQDEEGNTLQENLTTDADGKLVVQELKPGNYQFVEISTIPGYDVDDTPIPFEIALGQTEPTEVSFENPLTPGAVALTKVGEEGEALEGAEFTLRNEAGDELQTGLTTDENGQLLIEDLKPDNYELVEMKAPFGYQLDETPIAFEIVFDQQETLQLTMENSYIPSTFELTKQGEDGRLLEGVVFELQDSDGETLQEGFTTDEQGKITIADLDPGSYQLVETETIPGYDLDATPIMFDIGLGQTETTEVSFENPLTPGSVALTKVGEADSGLTGAIFELQNEQGETLQMGLATDENGKLVIEDLKPGSYQLVETEAPFGYELDSTPIPFEIDFDQEETLNLTMENSMSTGSVELTKVDEETGETLAGATFELQQEGKVLQENLKTDANGKLLVEDLTPGTYQFVETEAPDGYQLDTAPLTFTIDLGQSETLLISTDNAIVKGDFELTKVDFDNPSLSLAGVKFELQDAEGNILREDLVTGQGGKLLIEDLRPGRYLLKEVKPLEGYRSHLPVSFTIDRGQLAAKKIELTNKQIRSGVELIKLDSKNKEKTLQGAEFSLKSEDGELIAQDLTTDENGMIVVDYLKPGEYYFTETKAPKGYTLDSSPIRFTIELGQSERTKVEVLNQMEENDEETTQSTLPATATNIFNYTLFGSLLVIGGMITFMFYRRRRQ
ncbi:hypothetical protein MUN88_04125 [Gracilibacillus caseinilyticus]|uniref:LPXTG-motif cell wall anchor domain-containing protein n=1 Tax=Gracilibacillus caseinilyticus TaxID=2932256 RepID=A0ABY4F082_9BACI|nr:SpaA isopeptide-forming pilin-related protein [Gracilibacillus caseinilyticus]UOQ49319.1 hypothetical protein MUN88_04125 [Gracilibacillus caseinilyticus]